MRSSAENEEVVERKAETFMTMYGYLAHSVSVDLNHLQARMIQTGNWQKGKVLSKPIVSELLNKRFRMIDYTQAKEDVIPYIINLSALDLWSAEFFLSVAAEKLASLPT